MSNGETDPDDPLICCLLEICCEPVDAEAALASELAKHPTPEAQAKWLRTRFDFAPAGSLRSLKRIIAAMARAKG